MIDKAALGIIEGLIVHYTMPDGQHRPAIIVNAWRDTSYQNGEVNLSIFTDYANDVATYSNFFSNTAEQLTCLNGHMWKTSVPYSEGKENGTYHFIET